MKNQLLIITGILCSINSALFAQVDPCTNIQTVTCGISFNFSSDSVGYASYPNNFPCYISSNQNGQGGEETIYHFNAPATGYYQINCDSLANDRINTGWKYDTSACNASGWTCMSYIQSAGPVGAVYLNAGQGFYLILNAHRTSATFARLTINCVINNCNNIQPLTCNTPASFFLYGVGNPYYSNNFPCYVSSNQNGQGGQDLIFHFTAPDTGYYQINLDSLSAGRINFGWKPDTSGCDSVNWQCMNYLTTTGPVGAVYLNAGESIYLLANAHTAGLLSAQLTIHCAINICNSIQAVNCGVPFNFNSYGFGDPRHPNNTPCYISSNQNGQGGQETIYHFTALVTGYFQINLDSLSGGGINSGWKFDSLGCDNLNWSCMTYRTTVGPIGAVLLNAGQSIFIITNTHSIGRIRAQITVGCAIDICSNIQNINCSTPAYFNSYGFGNSNHPNNTPCFISSNQTGQGGQEFIYHFTAPLSGSFPLYLDSLSGSGINFGWKNDSLGCNDSDWTCISYRTAIGSIGSLTLNTGQSIYIIANTHGTGYNHARFTIGCPVGINEIISANTFSISPNPVSDILNIERLLQDGNETTITITDIIGQVIYLSEFIDKAAINVSGFSGGVYLAKLENEKGFSVNKFIKE